MLRKLLLGLALVAVCSAAAYPRYQQVIRDPKSFDLLFSSTTSPHNETWYFNIAVNLSSITIPSQIFNFWSSGPWTSGTYKENLQVVVHETRLTSPTTNYQTYEIATGSVNATANFGEELEISLWNATTNSAPLMQRYVNNLNGYRYTISIIFKTTGIYPWYSARTLSTYSTVNAATNTAGIIIGTSYNVA